MNNETLIQKYRETNNEEYFNKLLYQNNGMIQSIISKYVRLNGYIHTYEELYQVACIGLFKASQVYDESTGNKFSTLCHKSIYNEIRTYQTKDIRRDKNIKYVKYNSISLDKYLNEVDESITYNDIIAYDENIFVDPQKHLLNNYNKECINRIMRIASPKQKEIIELLSLGMTQTQIAEKLNVSPQCINENLKRLRKKIINFVDRY